MSLTNSNHYSRYLKTAHKSTTSWRTAQQRKGLVFTCNLIEGKEQEEKQKARYPLGQDQKALEEEKIKKEQKSTGTQALLGCRRLQATAQGPRDHPVNWQQQQD